MKKFFLLLVSVIFTVSMMGQSVVRTGNTYVVDGQSMKKGAFAQYMQASAEQQLATKFKSGLACSKAGWSLFTVGLASEVAGAALAAQGIINIVQDVQAGTTDKDFESIYAAVTADKMTFAGVALIAASPLFTLSGIICLGTGYGRMHNAADMYAAKRSQPQAYLSYGVSPGQVSLAVNF